MEKDAVVAAVNTVWLNALTNRIAAYSDTSASGSTESPVLEFKLWKGVAGEEVLTTRIDKFLADRTSSKSTARSLLKHAGVWQGHDLSELLDEVYRSRTKTEL